LYYPARAKVETLASAKSNNPLCRLGCRPQEICPGDEIQGAGDDVDAALGDGADPPLPAPAQQGVAAE